MRPLWIAASSLLGIASVPAEAGGSSGLVRIDRLVADGVNYTLVVTPDKSAQSDPYLGGCDSFEVRGTYRWLRGTFLRQEPPLSRRGHLEALGYLRNAFETRSPIELGWIGNGFVPLDSADPCVVRSRALWLNTGQRGTSVVSFHDSTSARVDWALMCLEILLQIPGNAPARISAKRLGETSGLVVRSTTLDGQAALHLSVSGGCSCEFLAKDASADQATWDLEPMHLPKLEAAVRALSLEARKYRLLLHWLGGERDRTEVPVSAKDLMNLLQSNSLSNNVLYCVGSGTARGGQ
jgi:hypothetical protein